MNFDYSGKNVFVTGADGFIGSHLVEALVRSGAHVKALVYYNSWSEIGWLSQLSREISNSIEYVQGDVRDASLLSSMIKGSNHIFHLSSLIGIPYSYVATQSYLDTNVTGALNVAKACLNHASVDSVLHVSTSEVYGSAQYLPMNERHPIVAQSPYSASKIAADKIMQSFNLSFDLPVIIARPFNTYGPRQTARAVISNIIRQVCSPAAKELVLGNVETRRDFNYVSDTVNGILALSNSQRAIGQEVNIGSGVNHSIYEVALSILEQMSCDMEIVYDKVRDRPSKSEVVELLCDNSKLLKLTNWEQEFSLEAGLLRTIEWVKSNFGSMGDKSYLI
jgi:NAD dependent epimerase/dehydratase